MELILFISLGFVTLGVLIGLAVLIVVMSTKAVRRREQESAPLTSPTPSSTDA